jgi:thiamine pyrophosphokinase
VLSFFNLKNLLTSYREAVLFANGEYVDPSFALSQITSERFVVAVDGGANFLFKHHVVPHLLIGDLDSVGPEILPAWIKKCFIKEDLDQNTFDLEKAVLFLLENGIDTLHIVGATGGRLDHSVANLYLLSRFADKTIFLIDSLQKIFVIDEGVTSKNTISEPIGTSVSLLPLGDAYGVNSSGLKYACRDLDMKPDGLIGSSNEMSEPQAEVSVKRGKLAVILGRKKTF